MKGYDKMLELLRTEKERYENVKKDVYNEIIKKIISIKKENENEQLRTITLYLELIKNYNSKLQEIDFLIRYHNEKVVK